MKEEEEEKNPEMPHHQKPDLSLCRVRLPPSHEIVSLICATIWTAKPADESARLIFDFSRELVQN